MIDQSVMDKIANVDPLWIVAIILGLTLVRLTVAKSKDRTAMIISETCDTFNFVLAVAFLLIRPFVLQAFVIPSESMQSTLEIGDRLVVDKISYRFHEPEHGDVIVFDAPKNALIAAKKDPNIPQSYIKRLIGLSGDKIKVEKAKILIDGVPVDTEGKFLHDYLAQQLNLDYASNAIKLLTDKVVINGPKGQKILTKPELAQALGRSPDAKIEIIPGQTFRNGQLLDEPYTREDPDYNFPDDNGSELTIPAGELLPFGDNRNFSSDGHVWGTLPRKNIIGHALCLFLPVNRIGRIH
jgi:signal peptidase I